MRYQLTFWGKPQRCHPSTLEQIKASACTLVLFRLDYSRNSTLRDKSKSLKRRIKQPGKRGSLRGCWNLNKRIRVRKRVNVWHFSSWKRHVSSWRPSSQLSKTFTELSRIELLSIGDTDIGYMWAIDDDWCLSMFSIFFHQPLWHFIEMIETEAATVI